MAAQTTASRWTRSAARELLKLIDALDDNDDVQNVYANFEISDAVIGSGSRPERGQRQRRSESAGRRVYGGPCTTCVRLLGLDPGLRCTGWGVIEAHGNRLRHVARRR